DDRHRREPRRPGGDADEVETILEIEEPVAAVAGGEDELVGSGAAGEPVGPDAAADQVGAVASGERVAAGPAVEDIVDAADHGQRVVTTAAVEFAFAVGARFDRGHQDVVPVAAVEEVVRSSV